MSVLYHMTCSFSPDTRILRVKKLNAAFSLKLNSLFSILTQNTFKSERNQGQLKNSTSRVEEGVEMLSELSALTYSYMYMIFGNVYQFYNYILVSRYCLNDFNIKRNICFIMQKYYFVPGQYCPGRMRDNSRLRDINTNICSNSMILSLENLGKERNNFDDLIHG